ncbi:MAG: hypothetical protein R6W66_04125 [Pelovirga sp.]
MTEPACFCGDTISLRCTTCRKTTTHTVLKVVAGVPTRAACTLCQRERACRPSLAARRSADGQDALRKEWSVRVEAMNPAKATTYTTQVRCKANLLIAHPVFGLGVVERLSGSQKMEVLFEAGRKVMRCQ